MQIRVTLTEKEVAEIRDTVGSTGCMPNKVVGKIMKALEPRAVSTKSRKNPGAIQMLGRADLKFIPASTQTIDGEEIATAWKLANAENAEPCGVCGKGIRGARLTFRMLEDCRLVLTHRVCGRVDLNALVDRMSRKYRWKEGEGMPRKYDPWSEREHIFSPGDAAGAIEKAVRIKSWADGRAAAEGLTAASLALGTKLGWVKKAKKVAA